MISKDPEVDLEASTVLTWARVLLFVRAHGVAGFALIIALYAMGFFSRAQTFGCGV